MRSVRLLVVVPVALLMLAACGGGVSGTGGPSARASDSGGARGTAPRAYTLDEALATNPEGPILVTGLLIDAGNGWRLCSAIAESYPPQCGGKSVKVDGVDASQYDLQDASGVRWAEGATVLGELREGTLTVTGAASAG